jgi:hypothetical protein
MVILLIIDWGMHSSKTVTSFEHPRQAAQKRSLCLFAKALVCPSSNNTDIQTLSASSRAQNEQERKAKSSRSQWKQLFQQMPRNVSRD